MSAEIINFPSRTIGARQALVETVLSLPNEACKISAEAWSDWVLAELWMRGFIVVRVNEQA